LIKLCYRIFFCQKSCCFILKTWHTNWTASLWKHARCWIWIC